MDQNYEYSTTGTNSMISKDKGVDILPRFLLWSILTTLYYLYFVTLTDRETSRVLYNF